MIDFKSWRVYVPCVALLMLGTSSMLAQSTVRDAQRARCMYRLPNEIGLLDISAMSNQAKWYLYSHPTLTGVLQATHTLPFDRPGSATHLGNRKFLLAGKNSGTGDGWLQKISISDNPVGVTVDRQKNYGSLFDPRSAKYQPSEDRLYVYDETGKRLLAAGWDGQADFPAPGTFTVLFDGNSFPLLGKGDIDLSLPKPPMNGILLREWGDRIVPPWRVYFESNVWKKELLAPLPNFATQWQIQSHHNASSRGPLRIKGPAAFVKLVDKLTGVVVASFTNPGGDVWNQFPLASPDLIVPGYAYCLSGGTIADSRPWRPLARWGEPNVMDNTRAQPGFCATSQCYVGNQKFVVSAWLRLDVYTTQQFSGTYNVYLYAAGYVPGQAPPLTFIGNVAYLNPINVFGPKQVTLKHDKPAAGMPFEQPIPNDANLVGAIPLWQMVIVTPQQNVVVSDVFGTSILDAPGIPPTIRAVSERKPGNGSKRALADMFGRISADERELYAALKAKLISQLKKR